MSPPAEKLDTRAGTAPDIDDEGAFGQIAGFEGPLGQGKPARSQAVTYNGCPRSNRKKSEVERNDLPPNCAERPIRSFLSNAKSASTCSGELPSTLTVRLKSEKSSVTFEIGAFESIQGSLHFQ